MSAYNVDPQIRSRSNSPNMAAWNSNGSQNSVAHLDPLKGTVLRDSMGGGKGGERGKDLSRDDLVFLLSIMEGELQARDEVITVLKAEKMDLALLEAQYGFLTPVQVLRALQRDSLQAQASEAQEAPQQDVYEKSMAELDRLVETGKQSYRRMLDQLLQVECSHSGALCRLEEQDQQHRAFLQRSDDLTCLLEQDRERSPCSLWRSAQATGRQPKGRSQGSGADHSPPLRRRNLTNRLRCESLMSLLRPLRLPRSRHGNLFTS
ncbi:filamin A-interacting protein 1-like [Salvelinus fontinalis]|uniref:filamin A-interacting protein 1-like n=1 Tax=Salvelinus fontinalis TaxID=8038 RepID=UPI002485C9E1|nr:filamin A-interacting protein 1-like [Salvelinus fontinalis]